MILLYFIPVLALMYWDDCRQAARERKFDEMLQEHDRLWSKASERKPVKLRVIQGGRR